jgi:serine/threonine transporter
MESPNPNTPSKNNENKTAESVANKSSLIARFTKISLIKRIIIGLVIGIILSFLIPADTEGVLGIIGAVVSLLGTLFVSALRAVAPILVFFLVMSALMRAKAAASMKTIIVLYVISTLIASIVAVLASTIFPLDLVLSSASDIEHSAPSSIGEILTNLLTNIVANPIDALANANFLGILAWSCVLGIAMRKAPDNVKDLFLNISNAVSTVVRWVINLAPFGIMGLIYTSVSTSGLDIFVNYGRIILLLVGCMLFIAFVTNPIIVFAFTRTNPYPLVLRCLKDSGITAFFTRSSAANIPVNMELCRKLGLDKDSYSVSIPLGATINMAGAAVTITVMSLAAVHTLGIQVDIVRAVILSVLAAVSACGASGVAGGSLLLIPLACSLFGIDASVAMEVVAVGFIIGVVQDSCETALNSSSDVLFTATAEYYERRKHGIPFSLGKDEFSLDELD